MLQFELPAKPLSQPQRDPFTPSQMSIKKARALRQLEYDPRLESHTYLAAIHQISGFAQITNYVTTALSVQSTADQNDDALIRLQESMAAALKGNKAGADGGVPIISISEDPELAKKKAEIAERDKARVQRRRQNQEERDRDRTTKNRTVVRTGLSVIALEDESLANSRARAKPARKSRRRNSEYSEDEEEYGGRARSKEDGYDVDGEFVVNDEEEVVENVSDDEESIGEDDTAQRKIPNKVDFLKGKGGENNVAGVRTNKRRVINDDDDE